MATASALSRSAASTEPRYSPLLQMTITRQLRKIGGGRFLSFRGLDLLLLAWIVRRVDVIDASRTDKLNLQNAFLISGPSVVSVLRGIDP